MRNSLAPILFLAILLATSVVTAETPTEQAKLEADFQRWLAQIVWPDARKQGIGRKVFDAALDKVSLDLSLPDLVLPGSRELPSGKQSEFSSPGRYFKPSQVDYLARQGKALLEQWREPLNKIEATYGVPREIIVAIWGRESNFGKASLPHDAVRVLATESFLGARKEKFYPELLAALAILQQDHIVPSELKSSWAGALGNPQFLPTKFLAFAVDFDKDGRRDIWHSVPDSLASIGNYLNKHGWVAKRGWGYEIALPDGISCTLEGRDQGKKIAAWEKLGVKRIGSEPFPSKEKGKQGFLMLPAGRLGPRFLATENFFVLKDYNESDLYALFIGHLADRMKGGGPILGTWDEIGGFTRADVLATQLKLQSQGHDVGKADGLVGFKTRRSLGRWQEKQGLKATCFPDAALIGKIR
ncbi:MAG: lytic murein transglycosylase [Gammaproteobacteria bacterium]|nr:lytic murein transglycosylase [Gammaproteobacteria bacterium]MBU1653580.1 lytic murein transglycosylase [Gammaproteobacteria bacterium]MBU1962027.1 lytic murein transglycosylase [Gammaproteobacteria bacterium]